jgi:hypothetical protein
VIADAGEEYVRTYLELYKTISDIHDTPVIIDGQKNLIKTLVMRGLLGKNVRVKVLHLARDPRGYFDSFNRRESKSIEEAARDWMRFHSRAARLQQPSLDCDYLFLRHEDLCQAPADVMQRVFDFFGVENQDVCRPPVNLKKYHLMGNSMLFEFDGTVRRDSGWQKRLSWEKQMRLLELTRPLCSRFGYNLEAVNTGR